MLQENGSKFSLSDQLDPLLSLVCSWQKMEFDSWPVLLDEVQYQYDINAAKTTGKPNFKLPDKNQNQNLIRPHNLIKVAAEQGAGLVVLPVTEMWNCPYSADNFARYAEDFGNGFFSMLSEVASCYRIVGGSTPELCNGWLYNTCCVFGSDGKLKAKHRKIHLFAIDIPGDISYKESDLFAAGDEPRIVDTEIGRIGIGICHDIRFPELAMLYKAKGAHLICYPGAFNNEYW
ncbi:Carbon-nitrogen hydrolase [Corchorus capsularis]|uniref:Carbon-nitrogen hydrolase n=1 Tax=Corchorus capsularis TaxID=210143 RepID=A0A1R3IDI3_COCAP|nr:Carbon-nitrogen hydrolase [Corchorus capsularis]